MHIHNFLQYLTNNQLDAAFFQKTNDEWKRFMEGETVNLDIIPIEIYNSWQRSKLYGIDPYRQEFLVDKPGKEEIQHHNKMLDRYKYFFSSVEEINSFYDFSFMILDNNCVCKYSVGLKATPGCIKVSEKVVGTTAYSIALQENRPVVVFRDHHYLQNFKNLNGASAPIHDENKSTIGALVVLFSDTQQAPRAYWTAQLLAKVFDNFYVPIVNEENLFFEKLMDLFPKGIAFVNDSNVFQYYNNKMLELLEINKMEDIQTQLKKYLPKFNLNENYKNKLINIDINGKQLNTQLSCEIIKDQLSGRVGKLVQLQDYCGVKEVQRELNENNRSPFDTIIGNSKEIKEAKSMAEKVAQTSVPILLCGENGTGKELFAQAIHNASPRRNKPFIAINCGALPTEIVESELFGYEEGSFTGALKGGKVGKIEAASGGTLFLDEIESMPLLHQVKLLRVLANGKIQKVGGIHEIPVDFRLIAATKKELIEECDNGNFREDLFYRISTIVIELPALKNRIEDIKVLAKYFVKEKSKKYSQEDIQMNEDFQNALVSYSWRGNVRELEHVIERALILLGDGKKLTIAQLPKKIQADSKGILTKEMIEKVVESEKEQNLFVLAEEVVIEHVLKTSGGNVSKAAKKLGINRRTLYYKLKENPKLKALISKD